MEGVQSSARPICRFLVPSSVIPCSSVSAPGHHGHLETIERPHIKKANFEVPIPRPDSGRQNAKHPVDPNSSQGSSLNFPPPSRSAGWLSFQSSGSTGQSMLSVHNLFDFRGSILWSGIRPLFLPPLFIFQLGGPKFGPYSGTGFGAGSVPSFSLSVACPAEHLQKAWTLCSPLAVAQGCVLTNDGPFELSVSTGCFPFCRPDSGLGIGTSKFAFFTCGLSIVSRCPR